MAEQQRADTPHMNYVVLRWNTVTSTYLLLQPRFETYGEAEAYGAERHQETEETARLDRLRGKYAPNVYRFIPISDERRRQVVGKNGQRVA